MFLKFFFYYMQPNYEIIFSDLGYKVAYKIGSLGGLSIEIVSRVEL